MQNKKTTLFKKAALLLTLLALILCATPTLASEDQAPHVGPLINASLRSPDIGDIFYEEAFLRARKAWLSHIGRTDEDAPASYVTSALVYTDASGKWERAWHIAFHVFDITQPDCALLVLADTGRVLPLIDEYDAFTRQAAWEAQKGPMAFWPLQDKELFEQLYTLHPYAFHINSQPFGEHLTEEQAIQSARNALERAGIAPESYEDLAVAVYFTIYRGDDAAYIHTPWSIFFVEPGETLSDRFRYHIRLNSDGSPQFVFNRLTLENITFEQETHNANHGQG